MRTEASTVWKQRWAEARANGTAEELSAEIQLNKATRDVRRREEDLDILARLKKCTSCGREIPSLSRTLCPPCSVRS